MQIKLGNKQKNKTAKYTGYTLVELLVSIAIMMIVIVLVSATFMTIIKASIISNALISTRSEADFSLRVVENSVKQSKPDSIFLFDTINLRKFNSTDTKIEPQRSSSEIQSAYLNVIGLGTNGNEIHILPNGGTRWICIAYFIDSSTGKGVLLKTSSTAISNLTGHEKCFDSSYEDFTKNIVQLTTESIDIHSLLMNYYYGDNENAYYILELKAAPAKWFGNSTPLEITRQTVVNTRKLTSVF
jgi:type II secretory pathway pseudopilin PulG